jgi:hypothetical protein
MRQKSLQRAEKTLRRLRLRRNNKNQTLLMAKQKGHRQKNTLTLIAFSFVIQTKLKAYSVRKRQIVENFLHRCSPGL